VLEAQVLQLPETAAVRAAPFRTIVSLAGPMADLGVALPGPGRVARHDGVLYLWAGMETWLAMADDPGLEDRLRAAAPGVAVTDQSDGKAILLVHGPRATDILAKVLQIDLETFGEDSTALTLAGHIPVQIWREDDAFALACFRSYAESLNHALARADTGRG